MSSLELYRVLFLSSICRQLETQRDPSSKLPNRGRCSTLHLFLMQINEYTIHNARAAKRIFFTLCVVHSSTRLLGLHVDHFIHLTIGKYYVQFGL